MRAAVARLGIVHPVMLDTNFALWHDYENEGWPARYLWNGEGHLADYHYGEGAYAETELAIQALLGTRARAARAAAPGGRHPAPASSCRARSASKSHGRAPIEAGGVWAVLEPRTGRERGTVALQRARARDRARRRVTLIEHERHSHGELELSLGADVRCDAVCFTAGLAP